MNIRSKLYLQLLLCIFGCLCLTNFSQAAWVAPTGNPYSGNDIYNFIPNSADDNTIYIIQKPFGIDSQFTVGANLLYINRGIGRVGVGTNNPQTTLDVWGTVKSFNTSTLPTCNSDLLGAIIFNTNQNRLNVCVNNAWHRIGYDGDNDHYLDIADCNDNDASINPGVAEVCGNSTDENCDGSTTAGCVTCYRDADGDGYGNPSVTAQFPGCPGVGNYVSNNLDCDDTNASKAVEICGDTISNDCDAQINEGCACTVNDWSAPVCPDMSTCLNPTTASGIKLTDCQGIANQPGATCYCTCRLSLDHFTTLTAPTCPTCRTSSSVLTVPFQSGVSCSDFNSIRPATSCLANCSGTCVSGSCCTGTPHYGCSGSSRVHYNACGAIDSTENCTYGCSGSSCNPDPCAVPITESTCLACGGSWSSYGGGGSCTIVH